MFWDAIGFVLFGMFVILGTIEPLIIVLTKPDHPYYHDALGATLIVLGELLYIVLWRIASKWENAGKVWKGIMGTVLFLALFPALIGIVVWFVCAGIVVVNYDNTCENYASYGGPNPNGVC